MCRPAGLLRIRRLWRISTSPATGTGMAPGRVGWPLTGLSWPVARASAAPRVIATARLFGLMFWLGADGARAGTRASPTRPQILYWAWQEFQHEYDEPQAEDQMYSSRTTKEIKTPGSARVCEQRFAI